MILPPERVGAYLRALESSLEALAPNDDHVPLAEAVAHLRALGPGLGGALLAPAEVSDRTGMPTYAWLDRARAEQVLAQRGGDGPSEAELARVEALDGGLASRMRARRDLHAHLRRHGLLPTLRLVGAARRLAPLAVALRYDRMAPDGRWLRLRVELDGVRGDGPLALDGGRLRVDEALQHFLTRHFADRLDALWPQLEAACGGTVTRLARSWVGPFWFPGVQLPAGVPAALGRGLVLQLSTEVAATDIDGHRSLDPLEGVPAGEAWPDGVGTFRERRFAATGAVETPCRDWAERGGGRRLVVPVRRSRPRRL